MPRKPPKPSPTKKSTSTAKKPTTRRTGPSADAKAGASAVKRKTATGQTKESAMDAAGRRYKVSDSFQSWGDKSGVKGTLGKTKIKDRVTGKETKKYVEWNDTMWDGPQKWSTSSYPDKKTASVMAKRAASKAATGSKIKKNAR